MALRETYVFKVVPMLNPEGVICGNFRCSLTGTDLNRRWDCPDETLHPQIFYLKNLMKKLVSEKKEILVFCDLHGHSLKNNAFIYGCNKAANGGFCSWTKVRLLPRILAARTPLFSYRDCRFRVESAKQRTARVVVWREFAVTNSFTLESSIFGYMRGKEIVPYGVEEYHELGQALLKAFLEYHYVLKGLENELISTHGWLKPSKLVAITGVLAADALAKKIEQEQEEEKRKRRRREIELVLKRKRDKAKRLARPSGKLKSASRASKKASGTSEDEHSPAVGRHRNLPSLRPGERRRRGESMQQSGQYRVANTSQLESNPYLPLIPTTKGSSEALTEKPATAARDLERGNSSPAEKNVDGQLFEQKDWRSYFTSQEINAAYQQMSAGVDPNDKEADEGSDSNPSEDNLEAEEMRDFICSLPRYVNRRA